jgi:hypothetical protein
MNDMFEEVKPNYNTQNNMSNDKPKWNNSNNNYSKKTSYEDDGVPGKLYKPYVISGNKETPPNIIEQMFKIAKELETFSYTLRISSMDGPDKIIEPRINDKELYLPWKDFDKKTSKLTFNTPESLKIAAMFNPSFSGLNFTVQAFLAKNARIVLGQNLKSPAMFVMCWSQDGVEDGKNKTSSTGNIGHIIAIASSMKIPVFNFGNADAEQRLKQYLSM